MITDFHWKKIGLRPHHGVALPLSALRSKKSCGIGEFLDLIPLIDWCVSIKMDVIQLLPINDSGLDPSPYNPLSSCALHPIYISLSELEISDLTPFAPLTSQNRIPYSEVLQKKLIWLRSYFQRHFSTVAQTPAYQTFLKENPWLNSYARFKAYKEMFDHKNWSDWPKVLPQPDTHLIDFYTFLQYLAFSQMKKVHDYAAARNLFLKGDMPILISPDSADVWAHPHLFRLDMRVGAPPDYYNAQGQAWGFPLIDWEAMRRDQFSWFHQRLKLFSHFFDIYRIDHVIGFFRIWAIPRGKKATEGTFLPADRALWAPQGRELLQMLLHHSPLLPIAEDLGVVPEEVYPILKELGICGTKVIRWHQNTPLDQYEPFSLTTVSTPDMAPLELWWKRFPQEAIPFATSKHWPYHPILSASHRLEILRDAHHTSSYFHINLLGEYLALFPPLVWPKPEEERINIPGTLLPTNWTYRFRPYLEEITSHPKLAEAMQTILSPP